MKGKERKPKIYSTVVESEGWGGGDLVGIWVSVGSRKFVGCGNGRRCCWRVVRGGRKTGLVVHDCRRLD